MTGSPLCAKCNERPAVSVVRREKAMDMTNLLEIDLDDNKTRWEKVKYCKICYDVALRKNDIISAFLKGEIDALPSGIV